MDSNQTAINRHWKWSGRKEQRSGARRNGNNSGSPLFRTNPVTPNQEKQGLAKGEFCCPKEHSGKAPKIDWGKKKDN